MNVDLYTVCSSAVVETRRCYLYLSSWSHGFLANTPLIVYAWVEFSYLRHTEQFDVADDELRDKLSAKEHCSMLRIQKVAILFLKRILTTISACRKTPR